jgi:cis-3-alkyl-4-acyloxetan-2-one decarboxylase
VLVHGDPTWGYMYREFLPELSKNHRCIVPDHMGMGKSEVPEHPYPYRLSHHIANLEKLLLSLELKDITLVLHDWGGPVGMGFAVRHPALIKRLVIMNTWAFAEWPGGALPKLLQIIRSDRGESFVLEKNGYVKRAFTGTVNYPGKVTTGVLDAYLAPFPDPGSRKALLCWTRDITFTEEDPSFGDMAHIGRSLPLFSEIPVLLIWGMRDPILPPSVLDIWRGVYPHSEVYTIEDASHFLQEDAPERVISAISRFICE